MNKFLIGFLAISSALAQQSVSPTTSVSTVDNHAALHTLPDRTGTGSPNARDNCSTVGETYFQTDATAGQNKWACTTIGTPGTWTLQGGSMVYPGAGVPISTSSAWGTSRSASDLAVSIQDFGGSPAASGSNNTSAFTSAAAVTGRVYLLGSNNCINNPGSCAYAFTWPLVISANVSVYGDGPGNTVIFSTGSVATVVSMTGANSNLHNVGIVCGSGTGAVGISSTNSNGELWNVSVTYCTTAGWSISGSNTDWLTAHNSSFSKNVGDGVRLTGANALSLTDNTLLFFNGGHGLNVLSSGAGVNVSCVSCSIQDNYSTDAVLGNGSNYFFANAYFETGLSGGYLTSHAIDATNATSVHITGGTRFKNYQSPIYAASPGVIGLQVDGMTEFNSFGLGGTNYTVLLAGSGSTNVCIFGIVDDQSVGMNLGTVVNECPNGPGGGGQIDLPAFQICITAGCGSEVSATRYPIKTTAGITLTDCSLNMAIPPTGSSVIVDIQTAAGVSIFSSTKLVFTTSGTSTTVVHQTGMTGMPLALDTLLKAVVTQNDSNGVGQFGYVGCH
jgi:hypothetical protein